jgi:Cd2+/Zn2+-exporting ATPase
MEIGMAIDTAERREWRVTGMDCGSCAAKVRGTVERLPGVADVDVALMAERLRLTLDESRTSGEKVEKAVRGVGFGIAPKGAPPEKPKGGFVLPDGAFPAPLDADDPAEEEGTRLGETPAPSWYATAKGRLVIGAGVLLALAWASRLVFPAEIAHWAFILATLIGLMPVARRAFAMARAGMPFTIEMLMTIAAGGALIIGQAEEAALVIFLFAVGELLEGVSAGKARDSIRALSKLVPKVARLEVDGKTREVAAGRLRVGQVVQVRPGDRVPCDGQVIEGISGVDESPVTGESVPSLKEPGADVFAGSINAEAVLRVWVTKSAEDNTIARIVRLVEKAESSRAPTERFIDRFSRVYMPAVVGMALLVAVVPPLGFGLAWGDWIYRALALLLIGCPCALVISVPASITSALSTGARNGLLMKGGAVIEAAARTTHVAFDKTGTLTHGTPRVTDVAALAGSEADLLALAAGVESGASHPLGQAICAEAEARGLKARAVSGGRALPGKGAEAMLADETVVVGSPRLAEERGALGDDLRARVAGLQAEGKTVVIVLRDNQPQGVIALRDEPRADAAESVAQLRAQGISALMLTGDNARTAEAIAGGLGIAHRADLMPEDKVTAIRELTEGAQVMMIGDGINDAPALARADVGVAIGTGTDIAIEAGEVVLMAGDLRGLLDAARLSRRTLATIRGNFFWAYAYNTALIPVAAGALYPLAGVLLDPMLAAGAMSLSSLFVVGNSLRLKRFRASRGDARPRPA